MATTALGTPYVISTDLVANYPTISSQLADHIDDVAVNPFATSTARGTAIPSPTEGMVSYLEDSNRVEFYNGTAWVPISGLTHLHTSSISAAGTTSINNVFSSAFDNYRVMVEGVSSTSTTARIRWRVGGVDSTANSYINQNIAVSDTTFTGGRGTSTSWSPMLVDTTYNFSIVEIANVAKAQPTLATRFGGYRFTGNQEFLTGSHGHNVSTAYDGLTFYLDTGTFTGTLRIYGYAN